MTLFTIMLLKASLSSVWMQDLGLHPDPILTTHAHILYLARPSSVLKIQLSLHMTWKQSPKTADIQERLVINCPCCLVPQHCFLIFTL